MFSFFIHLYFLVRFLHHNLAQFKYGFVGYVSASSKIFRRSILETIFRKFVGLFSSIYVLRYEVILTGKKNVLLVKIDTIKRSIINEYYRFMGKVRLWLDKYELRFLQELESFMSRYWMYASRVDRWNFSHGSVLVYRLHSLYTECTNWYFIFKIRVASHNNTTAKNISSRTVWIHKGRLYALKLNKTSSSSITRAWFVCV